MNLRLIKLDKQLTEYDLGRYDNFESLNQMLDQCTLEANEQIILEVCDDNNEIYFEEHLNGYGALSNKEQYEIEEALKRIEKKEMPTLDISHYQKVLKSLNCILIEPDFKDEDVKLQIQTNQRYQLPTGFYYQEDRIICDLIGDHIKERQEDFEQQLQLICNHLMERS